MSTDGNTQDVVTKLGPPPSASYLLAALRCARIRIQLLQLQVDEIGIALKLGFISPDDAIAWLVEVGADRFVSLTPLLDEEPAS
jgi:hypothetical protein